MSVRQSSQLVAAGRAQDMLCVAPSGRHCWLRQLSYPFELAVAAGTIRFDISSSNVHVTSVAVEKQ